MQIIQYGYVYFNQIQYREIMLAIRTLKILRQFGRLAKPKIHKMENIFELERDKSDILLSIEKQNNRILHNTKLTTTSNILAQDLGLSSQVSQQVANTIVQSYAYSTVDGTAYELNQKIRGKIVIEAATNNLDYRYRPGNEHLQLHYSIKMDKPNIDQYQLLSQNTGYLFNLPNEITTQQIISHFSKQQVKDVQIKYCQLGLPAYAIISFNDQKYFSSKFDGLNQIEIKGRLCSLMTPKDEQKLQLNRRQLVLKGLQQDDTPAYLVEKLSKFGRVMHLNMPMQIYKQPSINKIKQLYKNQKFPICINYHKKDGTIQSEYYPPFYAEKDSSYSIYEQKQQQYKRKLRYCQNVDVHEGTEDQVTVKNRGFCIVTFSCQQEAQNCYLHLRNFVKMDLVNDRDMFEFDQKWKYAVLRHIDNSYIQKAMEQNPYKQHESKQQKKKTLAFRSIFLKMALKQLLNPHQYLQNYNPLIDEIQEKQQKYVELQIHHQYRQYLNRLKEEVGLAAINGQLTTHPGNSYGKSFDELAQDELYGAKLREKPSHRYQVNIDDYVRQKPQFTYSKIQQTMTFDERKQLKMQQQRLMKKKKRQLQFKKPRTFKNMYKIQAPKQFKVKIPVPEAAAQVQGENAASPQTTKKPKGKFSTAKIYPNKNLKKSYEEKARSHMRYNKFIRDLINEYMGIFSTEKLEREYNRKKITFANPQNLLFLDGSDFISEYEVRDILQFDRSTDTQMFYNQFVKQNQIVKSTNFDLEESVLKDFENNQANALQYYTDNGVVKEQYQYQGTDNIEEFVASLNRQAQFGQQYKAVLTQQGTPQKIVKIAKLQNIYPLHVAEKVNKKAKKIQKQLEITPELLKMAQQNFQQIFANKPISQQFAKVVGLEKGTLINPQKFIQQVCMQLGVNKKDLQKLLNIHNYSEDQIAEDIGKQLQISKVRQKMEEKKASDFSRDPSYIKVKDRKGKAVVSKFRQI